MRARTEASAQLLPEITDHRALMVQDVTGSNGWEHVLRGRKLWFQTREQHRVGEFDYDLPWITSISDAISTRRWDDYLDDEEEEPLFAPRHFAAALELTAATAATAKDAAACDCMVRVEPEWVDGDEEFVHLNEYFAVLATRVLMLHHLQRRSARDGELLVLLRLMSIYNDRFSKGAFYACLGTRNECLYGCVIPLLEGGRLPPQLIAAILKVRWRTPGTDPKLWLNNAAWTYHSVTEIGNDEHWVTAREQDRTPPVFPELRLYDYPGYRQVMEVCTQNALDARNGVLDLRNPDWVRAYQERFEGWFNPINSVVG